jgi:hypothetical protein
MGTIGKNLIVVSVLFTFTFTLWPGDWSVDAHRDSAAGNARSPVIVELFTSESCSSCPPADALLSKLEDKQPIEGAEIIALEEHVDYWNNLGWRDVFSSHEYTERQQNYTDVLGGGSLYTPEIVVDGNAGMIGSRDGEVSAAIKEAARQPKLEIHVSQESQAPDQNELRFNIATQAFRHESRVGRIDFWMAVTERRLHSDVKSGENGGQVLHHASIVRSLRVIGSADANKDNSFNGSATVAADGSWKRENVLVVVFAQERKTKRILGAATSGIL